MKYFAMSPFDARPHLAPKTPPPLYATPEEAAHASSFGCEFVYAIHDEDVEHAGWLNLSVPVGCADDLKADDTALLKRLKSVGEVSEEIDTAAARIHATWVERRLQEGWKLSDVKVAAQQRSPYLVPYSDLPEAVQACAVKTTLEMGVRALYGESVSDILQDLDNWPGCSC